MEPTVAALYELLIDQQKSLRDLKLQVEGLKAMMFEHRPAFVEAHAAQIERLADSATMKGMDQRIVLAEELLQEAQARIS